MVFSFKVNIFHEKIEILIFFLEKKKKKFPPIDDTDLSNYPIIKALYSFFVLQIKAQLLYFLHPLTSQIKKN